MNIKKKNIIMTQDEVFKLRQNGNEVQRILDAESTMAEQTERAVAAAEAAAEDAQEVNEALQAEGLPRSGCLC